MPIEVRRKTVMRDWLAKETESIMRVDNPSENDLVIPIMGPTGGGKSSFINYAATSNVMAVGHDLESCTSVVQHYVLSNPTNAKHRIVLVDTPGFGDTYLDDTEVLKRIALWLARSYGEGMKLAGIVWIQDISHVKISSESQRNIDTLWALCGDSAVRNVILATTKWDDVGEEVGFKNEQKLVSTVWKDMIKHGSTLMRFDPSSESAWTIINLILDKQPVDFLLIQTELVKLDEIVAQTAAGQTLRWTLKELLEQQETLGRGSGVATGGDQSRPRKKWRSGLTPSVIATTSKSKASSKMRQKLTNAVGKESRDTKTVENPKESDIIIPIMGPAGVGKSTMINQIAGKPVMTVGHDLQPGSSSIQHVIIPHPTDSSRRIILVDTPGFDDTYIDDSDILRRIALWLARSYGDGMELAGIIYLHDISHSHISGKPRENLGMFRILCGEDSLTNVVLGTTKWESITSELGHQREVHLTETFWKEMMQYGSITMRLHNDPSSAWNLLNSIVQHRAFHKSAGLFHIQDKHVELQKTIPQTMRCESHKSGALQEQRRKARYTEGEHGAKMNCFSM